LSCSCATRSGRGSLRCSHRDWGCSSIPRSRTSPAPEHTDAPFADALRQLIDHHGLSLRTLADLTPAIDGKGLRHAYIGNLARGAKFPTVGNIELLARALGVEPEHFREYREHQAGAEARRLAERHGADAVLAKLAELD
jgi:transcriptional regulator with XRE-family HTH domain